MDLIIVKMRQKDESSPNIIYYSMKKSLTEVTSIRQVSPPRAILNPGTPRMLSVADIKTLQLYKYIIPIQLEMPPLFPNASAIQIFKSEIKGKDWILFSNIISFLLVLCHIG